MVTFQRPCRSPPSIGLILCKERHRVIVEYALRASQRPIGVSEYRLTEQEQWSNFSVTQG